MGDHKCFVSCSFDPEDKVIVDFARDLLQGVDLEPYVADWPRETNTEKKVRDAIERCDCLLAVATAAKPVKARKTVDTKPWIHTELGMARGLRKPAAVLLERGVRAKGLLDQLGDYVEFDRGNLIAAAGKIVARMTAMQREVSGQLRLDHVREEFRCRTILEPDGKAEITGEVHVIAVAESLAQVEHEVLLLETGDLSIESPEFSFYRMEGPKMAPVIQTQAPKAFLWQVRFHPPLRKNERAAYGFVLGTRTGMYPMTLEDVEQQIRAGTYHLPVPEVDEGFQVVCPTRRLVQEVVFPRTYPVTGVRFHVASGFSGPPDDSERARVEREGQWVVDGFGRRVTAQLIVPNPCVGFWYAVHWVPPKADEIGCD